MSADPCPRLRRRLPATLALALLLAGAGAPGPAAAGTFSVVTYNVAGLPEGISGSNPSVNTPLISPLLNAYDIAVVQEDFFFHDELVSQVEHPHLSPPLPRIPGFVGDGLNTFSRSPFSDFTRVPWDECFGRFENGADCLAHKGFTMARHELEPGVFLDVYDWHADAGGDEGSNAARRSNLRQLADWIVTWSAGQAVLVMGDSNSRYVDAEDIVPELVATAGLTDLWVDFVRGGDVPPVGPRVDSGCAEAPAGPECEQIDKIFYRSSDSLLLVPLAYDVPIERFLREDGMPLSDHPAVTASFAYQVVPEPGTLGLLALALALLSRARAAHRA